MGAEGVLIMLKILLPVILLGAFVAAQSVAVTAQVTANSHAESTNPQQFSLSPDTFIWDEISISLYAR
jgi:uncharacterized SAM-binding protein YcdF (DUF218 family)